jgi:hypothetical protein
MPPVFIQERYAVEDNRFDLRQLFYETDWKMPFREIDSRLVRMEQDALRKERERAK